MHASLKFSVVLYRTVKTKERVHSNKEAWQNYRNKAACKMTHQASDMTQFYASKMARRFENAQSIIQLE